MTTNFKILNDFKGFGNPDGKLWFIGIEEALTISDDNLDNIVAMYSNDYLPTEQDSLENDARLHGKSYTKVYDIMAKIIAGLKGIEDWRNYRNNRLLQADSNEFQMNLYPLGKKDSKTWEQSYEKLFGLTSYQEYVSIVHRQRFPQLKKYRELKRPTFTICFGKTLKKDFVKAFGLTNEIFIDYDFSLYPNDNVLVTPFFGNGNMGQNRINNVIEIMKQTINQN